jgi:hypothetical protein
MNYKIIIILLVLLFLIILICKEMYYFKDQFYKTIDLVNSNFKQENDKIVSQLQNNMIKCVTQIKSISNDNLQQLRKITMLNNQHVKNIVNHFTDESIDYTDNAHTDKNVDKQNNDIYYMSDDEQKNNSVTCEGDVCKRNIMKNNKKENDDDNNATNENLKTEYSIPTYVLRQTDDIPIYDELSNDDDINNDDDVNNDDDINNDDDVNNDDDINNDDSSTNDDNIDSDIKKINPDTPNKEKDLNPVLPPQNAENNNCSDNPSIPPKISNEADTPCAADYFIDNISENESESIEKMQLKAMKEYSYADLKEMSKKLSLDVSYKDKMGGRHKLYKKNELYKNIKSHLAK